MRFRKTILLLAIVACAVGLFRATHAYFSTQALEQGTARLTLYRSSVEAELRRFAHLPFVLSLDPLVADTLPGTDTAALDTHFARVADSAGIDAIYLMNDTGLTISASNAGTDSSFVGQNYAFRPYFQAAVDGALGEFYGIGATTGIPGYFFAMAVPPTKAGATGVIAIKLDLSELQDNWLASGVRIMLTNADGVVLLASDPAWRYRTLQPLSETQRDRIVASRQFGQEPLDPLVWDVDPTRNTANIGGERLLYLRTDDLPNDWSLHFFMPNDQALTRAALTTGTALFLAVLTLIALQIRRTRQMTTALQKSEQEEAQLRIANDRLAREIEERKTAERNLTRTQAELERAGRLAALGQLASSVTHELGQPIAAMRNQLVAAEMSANTGALSDKMHSLVARMEDITRQLKFFSRKGRDQFEAVDMAAAMADALDLLEPSIAQVGARIDFDPPTGDVTFRGNRLRIEQVMTNIVRNALDAIETAPVKQIEITMDGDADTVWFSVSDTGHGLGDKSFDDLGEPFATTRESGRGMGLGLTISAGIVADHGGTITAANGPDSGAVFSVTLPRAEQEDTP